MLDDYDYHIARAAMEDARADDAPPESAQAHRRLAELHRARGATCRFIERLSEGKVAIRPAAIVRTDKEA